jgi:hypothetical protein
MRLRLFAVLAFLLLISVASAVVTTILAAVSISLIRRVLGVEGAVSLRPTIGAT